MPKFKVGDVIVGNEKSDERYVVTTKKGKGYGVVVAINQKAELGDGIDTISMRWYDKSGTVAFDRVAVSSACFELRDFPNRQVPENIKVVFTKKKPKGELIWN